VGTAVLRSFGLFLLVTVSPFRAYADSDKQTAVGSISITHHALHSIKNAILDEADLPFAATVVGKSTVITANHVLSNDQTCKDRSFVFWKPAAPSPRGNRSPSLMVQSYPCSKIIATDPINDYTLAETEGDPSTVFGKVDLDLKQNPADFAHQEWTVITNSGEGHRRVRKCEYIGSTPEFLMDFFALRNNVDMNCAFEGSIIGGDSGSPVFNAANELAGVLRAQLRNQLGIGDSRFGAFVPVSAWLTEDIKKTLGLSHSTQIGSNTLQIGQKAEP
jgi:V8-like Glu-specific endopeptidase